MAGKRRRRSRRGASPHLASPRSPAAPPPSPPRPPRPPEPPAAARPHDGLDPLHTLHRRVPALRGAREVRTERGAKPPGAVGGRCVSRWGAAPGAPSALPRAPGLQPYGPRGGEGLWAGGGELLSTPRAAIIIYCYFCLLGCRGVRVSVCEGRRAPPSGGAGSAVPSAMLGVAPPVSPPRGDSATAAPCPPALCRHGHRDNQPAGLVTRLLPRGVHCSAE